MAWLVFQLRPKHFDRTESPEVHERAVFGNRQLLYLEPLVFFHGNPTVAFQCKQKSPMMVLIILRFAVLLYQLSPVTQAGWSPQSEHFHEHFPKIIVLVLFAVLS